jgi:acetylornithine deacetylase/succinyl-diaminopimelate desuccinylase-like protein/Na+/melibiose symporter-like transporter
MEGNTRKQLGTGRIFLFCLGDFARGVLGGLLVTYLLKFFNVTESSGLPLLLPAALIGTLRGASIVFDAVIDPWIANTSDKSKNRQGRRIPFMRRAAIPYALTCFLIFFPPLRSTAGALNAVWVMVMLLAYCLVSSLYLIPYQALQTEVVADPKRRVFFYTVQSFNFVIGSAVIYVLPVLVGLFRSQGLAAISAWQLSFGIFAVLGAASAVIPAFSIKEKDYVEAKKTYLPVLKSFAATLSYRQFRALALAFLVMQAAFAFFNTAMLYYIDVLLGLKESFATIVLGLSIVIGIASYPLVNLLARIVGKKPLLLFACGAYICIYIGIYFHAPVSAFLSTELVRGGFLLAIAGPVPVGNAVCGFLIGVLIAFPIACTNIIPYAAFADIAQYDSIVSGENKAGMFIAVRQFLYQFSYAVVTAAVSFVIYLGADGNGYPSVFGVRLTAIIAAAVIAAAFLLYLRYDDREILSVIAKHARTDTLGVSTLSANTPGVQNAEPLDCGLPAPEALARLSRAISIPTVSVQDYAETDFAVFEDFIRFLREAYPLFHETCELERVNGYALVYRWKGRDGSLSPMLLTAHYDVVPVEAGTEADWAYPPFSGAVMEGRIWGRGALDIKSQLTAHLEAAEGLMREDFVPERDLYFVYGQDEETGGRNGAYKAAEYFAGKGLRFEGVLDEGGFVVSGVLKGVKTPAALIGVAEKGFCNYELLLESEGGHSSMPPLSTALGDAAKLIRAIGKHPMPARLCPPVVLMMRTLAGEMGLAARIAVSRLFRPLLLRTLDKNPVTRALIRSTFAATVARAGDAVNVLPRKAIVIINVRLLPGDTVDSAAEHIKKLGKGLRLTVRTLVSAEASQISPAEGLVYRRITSLIKEFYPGALISPYLVTGGTDARKYYSVSDHVYRFTPALVTNEEKNAAHNTNESVTAANYARMIHFYRRFMRGN